MRKLFFYLLIVFTTIYTSATQGAQPDWIAPELKKYPIEKYLFHVGESQGTEEQALEAAVDTAHRRIATDILGNVERVIRYNKSELQHDMVREHYSAVLEDYCNSRQAWPAMKLRGFHVRNLTVDLARTDSDTYALAYIKRDELKQHYAEHVLELSKEINRLLKSAKLAEETYEIKLAVKKYLQTYPLYEALKEAEIVQVGAEYKYAVNSTEAFKSLAEAAAGTSDSLQMSHRAVMKRVAELHPQTIASLEDIARAVEFQFSQQRNAAISKCWIEPVIYEDSEMIPPFAQNFSTELLERLSWPSIEPLHSFKPTSPDSVSMNQMGSLGRLTSSCWENGDEITIRLTVRNVNTGNFVAAAVVQLLDSQLREVFTRKPVNYEEMRSERDAFDPQNSPLLSKNDEIRWSSKELKVEVWTHEGRGPLRYVQDEKVKIFVRVNQPAYVRLLYTLADRKRTLLAGNFHIDTSQVNSTVKIGEFLCTAPFGPELLVVAARTEKFPPIETYEENGYFYIVDADPEAAARRFRGLKRIPDPDSDLHNDEQQPPSFQQSEAQIVITTVEK